MFLAVFTLRLAFWIIENFFHFLEFRSGQVYTSIYVLILLIGSDPSEVNLKNAEKINQIADSLQSDNERRGSSAAESQGMTQKYIYHAVPCIVRGKTMFWRPPADQKARGLRVPDCNVLGAALFTNVDFRDCL